MQRRQADVRGEGRLGGQHEGQLHQRREPERQHRRPHDHAHRLPDGPLAPAHLREESQGEGEDEPEGEQRPRLLVNRGWVAVGPSRDFLPLLPLPEGTVNLSGRLDRPASVGLILGEVPLQSVDDKVLLQALDLASLLEKLGRTGARTVVILDTCFSPKGTARSFQLCSPADPDLPAQLHAAADAGRAGQADLGRQGAELGGATAVATLAFLEDVRANDFDFEVPAHHHIVNDVVDRCGPEKIVRDLPESPETSIEIDRSDTFVSLRNIPHTEVSGVVQPTSLYNG